MPALLQPKGACWSAAELRRLPCSRGFYYGHHTPIAPLPIFCVVQVAEELTAHDVIRAHARDELGIDLDDMS